MNSRKSIFQAATNTFELFALATKILWSLALMNFKRGYSKVEVQCDMTKTKFTVVLQLGKDMTILRNLLYVKSICRLSQLVFLKRWKCISGKGAQWSVFDSCQQLPGAAPPPQSAYCNLRLLCFWSSSSFCRNLYLLYLPTTSTFLSDLELLKVSKQTWDLSGPVGPAVL